MHGSAGGLSFCKTQLAVAGIESGCSVTYLRPVVLWSELWPAVHVKLVRKNTEHDEIWNCQTLHKSLEITNALMH